MGAEIQGNRRRTNLRLKSETSQWGLMALIFRPAKGTTDATCCKSTVSPVFQFAIMHRELVKYITCGIGKRNILGRDRIPTGSDAVDEYRLRTLNSIRNQNVAGRR